MPNGTRGINLKILSKSSNPGFIKELSKVPQNLLNSQGELFFNKITDQLLTTENSEIRVAIYEAIIRAIKSKDVFLKSFAIQGNLLKLSAENPEEDEFLLNILYILAYNFPESLTTDFVDNMLPLVKRNPEKYCIIVERFSQLFSNIYDPWPVVDVLIYQRTVFMNSRCVKDYISLLVHLCISNVDYRNYRQNSCWANIIKLLQTTQQIEIKIHCYKALTILAPNYPEGQLPEKLICQHIHSQNIRLKNNVLELLLFKQPKKLYPELLEELIKLAEKSLNASLIIIQLCFQEQYAEELINNYNWMFSPLPTLLDTFRIFLSALRHSRLHETIINSAQFPKYLTTIAKLSDPSSVSYVAKVLETFNMEGLLTKSFIHNLQRVGLLKQIKSLFLKSKTPKSKVQFFYFFEVIASVNYIAELDFIVEPAISAIKKQNEAADAAAKLIVLLVDYDKCYSLMEEEGLTAFFKHHPHLPHAEEYLTKFTEEESIAVEDESMNNEEDIQFKEEEEIQFEEEEENLYSDLDEN